MQKIFLPLLFVIAFVTESKSQQKLFDQAVQLKSCNISIDANPFIATTFIELEFYNPKDMEVEGYQTFELNRGQVITDFQLQLNGQYREGSIEERWKANRAYSAIVGKRVDPAILQMDWQNHYSLRIYPIAAHSSRKVSMTITQLMKDDSAKLSYHLPLNFPGTTESFSLKINVNNAVSRPIGNEGFLSAAGFGILNNNASYTLDTKNTALNKPVSFYIPLQHNQSQLCVSGENGATNFLLRYFPDVNQYYEVQPKSVTVFWDASKSATYRNMDKELDFLERYIEVNNISKTTIILFNQQLLDTINFTTACKNFYSIRKQLLHYNNWGATVLGNLDFSSPQSDAILLFSDGINSFGKALPKAGAIQVNCIVSGNQYNQLQLQTLIGNNGGSIIWLNRYSVNEAVKKIVKGENFLFRYNSPRHGITVNESMPLKLGEGIFLSGKVKQSDTLQLLYGNNNTINRTGKIFIAAEETCDKEVYRKMKMLKAYDSMMYRMGYYGWQDVVVFGLTEKVVTVQTSYLVLERIEDYINYKIAPPKELEQKCAEMNYVYKSEYKIKAMKTFTEVDALQPVVTAYNQRIKWWDAKETLIDLTKPAITAVSETNVADKQLNNAIQTSTMNLNTGIPGTGTANSLSEVVVTSAFGIKRTARSVSSSVQLVTSEQLNLVRETNINNALAGKVAGLQIRGQSSAMLDGTTAIRLRGESTLGSQTPVLYVLDGTVVPDARDINVDEIEDVTVLRGPSAAALFGSRGSNGAIVINSKKARRNYSGYNRWTEYNLNSQDEVEYMKEIRKASYNELWETYLSLEEANEKYAGFYFDMADYFFERGMEQKAMDILYNGIELCSGNSKGLKAAAYLLENRKKFDEAIKIYQQILDVSANDWGTQRDIALAYFQKGDFQKAVDTYYKIITEQQEVYYGYGNIKELALTEMNAVIALHKDKLDISLINQNLIRPLPVDLRIVVESNDYYVYNYQVTEPGGAVCNYSNPNTKNGGHFSTPYNYYYYESSKEYSIKNARSGRYRIKVNAYDNYENNEGKIPTYLRVIVFKNFQKENQTMEVQNIALDNQYGEVEIAQVQW